MASKKLKNQEKLMKALEQSLLAFSKGNGSESKSSKELKTLGQIMNRKDPPLVKQKRPDQKLYTVIKGKKEKDEDYVSMPAKKSEMPKKEVKKSKRIPVDLSALSAPAPVQPLRPGGAQRSATSRSTAPSPFSIPVQPVNQWNERTGADLFINPRHREFASSGLDFEDEIQLAIVESMRSAEQEAKMRHMYLQQHRASQLMESQMGNSYEAPAKELPFSSRNQDSIFFDDELNAETYSNYEPAVIPPYDSDDDWEPVTKKTTSRNRNSVSISSSEPEKKSKKSEKKEKRVKEEDREPEKKKEKQSDKKEKEKDSSSASKVESRKKKKSEEVAKPTGAIKKTKRETVKVEDEQSEDETESTSQSRSNQKEKSKKKSKKAAEDFASIVEAKLKGPEYPPPSPQPQRQKKSSRKVRSTVSTEQKLHSYGIDNDLEPEDEFVMYEKDESCHETELQETEDRVSPESHVSENQDEEDLEYKSQAYDNQDDLEEEAYDDQNGLEEHYYSEVETEDYDFYPESHCVTKKSHPELFDKSNFNTYYDFSPNDEFFLSLKRIPSFILRQGFDLAAIPWPEEAKANKIPDVKDIYKHRFHQDFVEDTKVNSNEQNPCVIQNEENPPIPSSISANEPRKRSRLPGSGRLKISSSTPEVLNASLTHAQKLQLVLSGVVDPEDICVDLPPSVPISSKPDEPFKFAPALEPIYEVQGDSTSLVNLVSSDTEQNSADTLNQERLAAAVSVLEESELLDSLMEDIAKLNISLDSPELSEIIQNHIAKLIDDPDSTLSKLMTELVPPSPVNGDSSARSSAQLPVGFSTVESSLPDKNIKPLPSFDLAASINPVESINCSDQNPYQNSILQMNSQPTMKQNPSSLANFTSVIPQNGSSISPYGLVNNHTTSNGLMDQSRYASESTLPQVPHTQSTPTSIAFNAENDIGTRTASPSILTGEAIFSILNQAIIFEAGESASAVANSPEFQQFLPMIVKTIQNEGRNNSNSEQFVETFARQFVQNYLASSATNSSGTGQTPAVPPGFSVQSQYPSAMHQVNSTTSASFPNYQGYPTSYVQSRSNLMQTNVFPPGFRGPRPSGVRYAVSSGHNGVRTAFYPPGFSAPHLMQSKMYPNINS